MVSKVGATPSTLTPFSLSPFSYEERVAEDAERVRVGFEALDDQVVVLAGLDEGTVLAHARADLLPLLLVRLLQVGHAREAPCSPCRTSSTNASRVPEVGGGPKTTISASGSEASMSDHFWFGIGDEAALAVRKFGSQRLEDLLLGEVPLGRCWPATRRSTGRHSRSALR